MSSEGWGIYNNSTRKSYFDVGYSHPGRFNIYNTAPEADFYLIAGGDMPSVLPREQGLQEHHSIFS